MRDGVKPNGVLIFSAFIFGSAELPQLELLSEWMSMLGGLWIKKTEDFVEDLLLVCLR